MYIIVKFYFTLFYMIFYVKIYLYLGVEKILIFNSLKTIISNNITYCSHIVHNEN
jgi:hypothetical protein